jgi:hypothetical protein
VPPIVVVVVVVALRLSLFVFDTAVSTGCGRSLGRFSSDDAGITLLEEEDDDMVAGATKGRVRGLGSEWLSAPSWCMVLGVGHRSIGLKKQGRAGVRAGFYNGRWFTQCRCMQRNELDARPTCLMPVQSSHLRDAERTLQAM